MLRELYGEGRYHIIPSFWRTIMYLKKQKKEFAIAFRTFGKDLDNAVYEFDRFCNGEHPCFNGRNNMPHVKIDGSKNTKDFRFKSNDQRMTMYRLGENINETYAVQGKHERVPGMDELNQLDDYECELFRDHL